MLNTTPRAWSIGKSRRGEHIAPTAASSARLYIVKNQGAQRRERGCTFLMIVFHIEIGTQVECTMVQSFVTKANTFRASNIWFIYILHSERMPISLKEQRTMLYPQTRTFPVPVPIPIRAVPEFFMISLTSAKSTLISPGRTMISDVPITWRK